MIIIKVDIKKIYKTPKDIKQILHELIGREVTNMLGGHDEITIKKESLMSSLEYYKIESNKESPKVTIRCRQLDCFKFNNYFCGGPFGVSILKIGKQVYHEYPRCISYRKKKREKSVLQIRKDMGLDPDG